MYVSDDACLGFGDVRRENSFDDDKPPETAWDVIQMKRELLYHAE